MANNSDEEKAKLFKTIRVVIIIVVVFFFLIFAMMLILPLLSVGVEQKNDVLESGQSLENLRDVPESKQSLGNLRNTRWNYYDSNFVGTNLITVKESIEFGNGNYVFNSETDKNSSNKATKTEIGTFKVSGDNVILTSSDGKEKIGIIVGRSLTIDGRTYR